MQNAAADMEADALAGMHVDLEDGVVALVAHGLRVRVDEPGLLYRVGDDEQGFAVGDIGDLESLLDDVDVPAQDLFVIHAFFAMLAYMLAIDVADGAITIGLLLRAGKGMERVGKDVAILIDVDAQGSIESVCAVIGRARWVLRLL